MQRAKLAYIEPKLIISLERPSEDFWTYLILGLRFEESGKTVFTKDYVDLDSLAYEVNQINSEIRDYGIEPIFDPFLSSLVKKQEYEEQELTESLSAGRKVKNEKHIKINLPSNFYREPKGFQLKSIKHIVSVPNSANFSVPGSGKTTISLAAYSVLRNKGIVDHLLVVCPISAFLPWEEEFEICFGRFPHSIRISGNASQRNGLYEESEQMDLFLVSYQMLKFEERNIEVLLKKHKFFMILDESHHIKNFYEGVHANVARRLGIFARRRLILSGTPVPNGLEDLWSQFTFLWPKENLLGTKSAYKGKLQNNATGIKRAIDPLFIRITKDELKIPKPIVERVKVKLNDEHYEFYHELSRTVLYKASEIRGEEERAAFYGVCIPWLLEAIDDPNRLMMNENVQLKLGKNAKLARIFLDYRKHANPKKISYGIKIIRSLIKNKEKVLLWTYFVKNIETLGVNELKNFRPLLLYGEIPRDDVENEYINREKNIRIFKRDPKRKLMIANPAACAESISLHKVCKNSIYLDRTFNCAQYLQSMDRIHRLGIKVKPRIRLLIASKTLDEIVDRRLEEKRRLMLRLLDDPFEPINLETSEYDYFGEVNKEMKAQEKIDLESVEEELKCA